MKLNNVILTAIAVALVSLTNPVTASVVSSLVSATSI